MGYELDGEHPGPAIRAQLDLAKRIGGGITNQSASGWERGIAKPSRDNILNYLGFLAFPRERLLTEGDETTLRIQLNSPQPG
jgi:Helix-turn-helix